MLEFYELQKHPAERVRGKYPLPHPITGNPGNFTSVTTFGKSLGGDAEFLTKWQKRKLVKGLGFRPDLYALACSVPEGDSKRLDELVRDAEAAGAIGAAANLGTAMHDFTETADRGDTPFIPDEYRADLQAYQDVMRRSGIEVMQEHIETVVFVPGYELVGRIDRIVRHEGKLKIADLKTGKNAKRSAHDHAVQLACYANASHIWNEETGTWGEMPEVDKAEAIVMSVPIGSGTCTLYSIDVNLGWKAAVLCEQVRKWKSWKNVSREILAG